MEALFDGDSTDAVFHCATSGGTLVHPPTKLYDLVSPADSGAVLREVLFIAEHLGAREFTQPLRNIHLDVERLFRGMAQDFQASNTAYHDLEHTFSVVLAAARLFHGCDLDGTGFAPETFVKGLIAAYFHDSGLIMDAQDTQGTGAKLTVGHELRSTTIMERFVAARGFTRQDRADISDMILCTELARDPASISFRTEEIAFGGFVVGTADLIAQIADRRYLEKLPLLFKEFEEAGLPGFSSELDLLKKTGDFYEHIARPRLEGALGNLASHLESHFQKRWNLSGDLYAQSVARNLVHLQYALTKCPDSYECLLDFLRRSTDGQQPG